MKNPARRSATLEDKRAAYDRGFAAGRADARTVIYHPQNASMAARNANLPTIDEEGSYRLGYDDGVKAGRKLGPRE